MDKEHSMTKQEIIQELFSESPAMAEHLCEDGNCDSNDLLNAICGAPISLGRKIQMLEEYMPHLSEEAERAKELIDTANEAKQNLEGNLGDVFLWRCCRYDREWPDDVGKSSFEPCASMDDVLDAIKANIEEDMEDMTDEERERATGCWYEVKKWTQTIDNSGQPHFAESPWEYIVLKTEVCYFRHKLTHTQHCKAKLYSMYNAFDGSSDVNLSIPFEVGDIVTLDCRPFVNEQKAALIEIGNGCCGTQVAFVDANGKLQTGALKHSHCFTDNYLSKLSPLYCLNLYKEELDEDENVLKRIHDDIVEVQRRKRSFLPRSMACDKLFLKQNRTKNSCICHEIDTEKAVICKTFESPKRGWQGNNPTTPDFEVLLRDIYVCHITLTVNQLSQNNFLG